MKIETKTKKFYKIRQNLKINLLLTVAEQKLPEFLSDSFNALALFPFKQF